MIAGAGCAGLSLACAMLEAGVPGRSIAIVDPRTTFDDDRTWCSFAVAPHAFSDVASHRWFRWRVAAEREVPRRISVDSATEARRADLVRARLDVLFPSVQLATLLVMLSFFLALRERMYAWYVVSMLVIIVYELYAFGLGFEVPPFDLLGPLGGSVTWAAGACALALLMQFTREYLQLHACAPRLDRAVALLRWPLLALVSLASLKLR